MGLWMSSLNGSVRCHVVEDLELEVLGCGDVCGARGRFWIRLGPFSSPFSLWVWLILFNWVKDSALQVTGVWLLG